MLAPLIALALCAQAWERVAEEDGLVLESQGVEGSSFERVRVTGTSRVSAEVFTTEWWGKLSDSSASPEVKKREIFKDEPNDRLYWDLVSAAPISERDYVVHMTRRRDEKTGVITIHFKTVDDARKPAGAYVRMALEGTVTVTPEPKGGCRFVYVMYSDVGGAVPALFTRRAQRNSALGLAREHRRRAEAGAKAP